MGLSIFFDVSSKIDLFLMSGYTLVPICGQKQNMPRGGSALFLALMVTQVTCKKKCALINRMGDRGENNN